MAKTKGRARTAFQRFMDADAVVAAYVTAKPGKLRMPPDELLKELRGASKDLATLYSRNGVDAAAAKALDTFALHMKPDWRFVVGWNKLRLPAWTVAREGKARLSVGLQERAIARLLQWEHERRHGRRDDFTLDKLAGDLGSSKTELLNQNKKAANQAKALRIAAGDERRRALPPNAYRHPMFVKVWREVQQDREDRLMRDSEKMVTWKGEANSE